MISTGCEWLHRVDSSPSGLMSQRQGSAVSGHSRPRPGTGKFGPKRKLALPPLDATRRHAACAPATASGAVASGARPTLRFAGLALGGFDCQAPQCYG
jgi:hypothetical protein